MPDPEITELSISKPDYTLNLQVNFLQYTGNHFTKCVAMIKKTCNLVYFSQLLQHNADVPYLQDCREKKTPQSNRKDQLQVSELSISKFDYGIPHSLIFFLLHTNKKTCKLGFFPSCYNSMQMYIYENKRQTKKQNKTPQKKL